MIGCLWPEIAMIRCALPTAGVDMTIFKADGTDIYYELHGDGPPLVFIHGASGTHLAWWQQVAEFRHHHSCLIYDLRGYGRSRPHGPYDVADGNLLLRDLEQLLAHVGFAKEKISIMGASLGTGPALHYAVKHRPGIDRLVMVCGPGGVTTPRIVAGAEARKTRMLARRAELEERFRSGNAIGTPGVPRIRSEGEFERFAVAYHPYGPVGEAMHLDFPALTFLYAEIMALSDGPPTVAVQPVMNACPVTAKEGAALDFPVLVVGGTEDQLCPPEELEDVANVFPNGTCRLVKGAGHLVYYERPRRFNDMVLAFLRGR